MNKKKYSRNTFKERSNNYNLESPWIKDKRLINPLITTPSLNKKLIDVCSGTGIISIEAIKKGWNVIAVDTSSYMLNKIPILPFLEKVICNAENIPFRDNVFDLLTCRQGLQYTDLYKALIEMDRITATQIRLGHITMENKEDESYWWDYFRIASPGRKHIFYPGMISEVCNKLGLNISKVDIIYSKAFISDSITHLRKETQNKIFKIIMENPKWWRKRYFFKLLKNNDFQYNLRWEFITINK